MFNQHGLKTCSEQNKHSLSLEESGRETPHNKQEKTSLG